MSRNPVCYWELASHNAEQSADFLKQVFGWESTYDQQFGIHEFASGADAGGFAGGGVFTLRKAKLPFLTIYIRVDDIDAKAQRIVELGGHIVEAPFDLPTGSRICLFNEPSGVTLAMIQPRAAN